MASGLLHRPQQLPDRIGKRSRGQEPDRGPLEPWRNLREQFEPLACQSGFRSARCGRIGVLIPGDENDSRGSWSACNRAYEVTAACDSGSRPNRPTPGPRGTSSSTATAGGGHPVGTDHRAPQGDRAGARAADAGRSGPLPEIPRKRGEVGRGNATGALFSPDPRDWRFYGHGRALSGCAPFCASKWLFRCHAH